MKAADCPGATIDGAEAARLLGGMRDAQPILGHGPWVVASEWNSFLARFVHVRNDAGDDVAIKFGRGWSAADVEYVSAEILRVRRLFSELPGGSVEVPTVLGWSPEPAAIALPFVSGENLFAALGDATNLLRSDGTRIMAIMRAAGEALGAYHSAERAPGDGATRRRAREDMSAAVRRSGYRNSLLSRIESGIPLVRGYRLSHNDFTVVPGNEVGSGLVVLDPPHVRKFDHLHRDLSAFTLALRTALVGERFVAEDDARCREFVVLRDEVLEGYRTTGPATLDTPLDAWLLRFYELSRIGSQIVGRLRSRRIVGATEIAIWWARERIALGNPPRG